MQRLTWIEHRENPCNAILCKHITYWDLSTDDLSDAFRIVAEAEDNPSQMLLVVFAQPLLVRVEQLAFYCFRKVVRFLQILKVIWKQWKAKLWFNSHQDRDVTQSLLELSVAWRQSCDHTKLRSLADRAFPRSASSTSLTAK